MAWASVDFGSSIVVIRATKAKNWFIFTVMNLLLVLFTSLPVLLGNVSSKIQHEFYVSITELRVDLEQDRITGSMQFFPDDWERAMNALVMDENMRYHAMSELQKDSLHAFELARTFSIQYNKEDLMTALTFSYIGSVTDNEYVKLFFSFSVLPKNVEGFNWNIYCSTLSDVFSSQENIITFYNELGSRSTNSCRIENNFNTSFF